MDVSFHQFHVEAGAAYLNVLTEDDLAAYDGQEFTCIQ